MTKTILAWAKKHPYLADHWFIYTYAWGAVSAGLFIIVAQNFFSANFPDQVADIPRGWRLLWALIAITGGLMVARGISHQRARIEAAGLVLLATVTILGSISRLADTDPIGVLVLATGLGLAGRALLVVLFSSRTAEKTQTRWRL